ncbi:hypothetical protein ITJ38_01415 [Agreia pratensis]|uniref:hypothetical protein n=1 Tax=Agreia pratensis TaxID=150121 RepID=UPI00188BF017|nr:hypothetical protein [Agreia pratensis]MBF4633056.1 hypothetical protein [Agreia pratensis]
MDTARLSSARGGSEQCKQVARCRTLPAATAVDAAVDVEVDAAADAAVDVEVDGTAGIDIPLTHRRGISR